MTSTNTAVSAVAEKPVRRGAMLLVVLTGVSMSALDNSIVNVAAPAIRNDIGATGALLQMVIAGYLLANVALVITAARLGDDYGYRRVFVTGVALFTVASLVCGLAPNATILIAARVVQGVGAALLAPQALSLIQRHFEGAERARAVGYYSMILALGVTLGQLLGGVIVTFDILGLSWRPAFLINVPIGVLLLASSSSALPEMRGTVRPKLDVAGVLVLALSMILVVVPLTFGREFGWPSWAWLILAVGIIGLGAFLLVERSTARRGGNPLLNLDIFSSAVVTTGLLVVFLGFVCYGGLLFAVALYLQTGLGFSPIESGLVFVAYSFGFVTANLTWSKMPPAMLRWTPPVSLLAMTVAAALFAVVAAQWGWTPAAMLPLLVIAGSGQGFGFGPVVNRASARNPSALSGLVATAITLSILVGLATLGTLYLAGAAASPATPSLAIAQVAWAIAGIAAVAAIGALRLASLPDTA
jgi:MFS family permease